MSEAEASKMRVSRRTTLLWFGAAAAGAGGLAFFLKPSNAPKGYGLDPNLTDPSVPWARTLSAEQLKTANALADAILPGDQNHAAPSQIGIADFVDEWVSAPYPDQQRDRALVLFGFQWLDTQSNNRWAKPFSEIDSARQIELLKALSQPPASKSQEEQMRYGFFMRFRSISVGAYYSTDSNFAEIGYIGNEAQQSFPPPTAEEMAFIEKAMKSVGI